jgi:histidinol-phosphate aminotransferase
VSELLGTATGRFPKRRVFDGRVNLSSNELSHPALAPLIRRQLSALDEYTVRRYPETGRLVPALAGLLGVPSGQCLATPGSDAAIRLVCSAYARSAGDRARIILQYPNYDAWEMCGALLSLPVTRVDTATGWGANQGSALTAAVSRGKGALVALSQPNGPGGWALEVADLDAIARACERHGHLLVIDGCYQVFHGPLDGLLRGRWPEAVVIQSLSKSHGLAGLRLAVIRGSAGIIAPLADSNIEGSVSAAALSMATAALEQSAEYEAIWRDIRVSRAMAVSFLTSRGYACAAAHGNFITVRIGDLCEAETMVASLSEAGYRVRNLAAVPGLEGCIRFTVCDGELTGAFLDVWEAAAQRGRALPGVGERALP